MKYILAVLIIFSLSDTLCSQEILKKIKEEYTIDNKVVTKEIFNNFLATLKELPHTWFCGETAGGGETGYDAIDKQGVVYEYRASLNSGISKNSIKKKSRLK